VPVRSRCISVPWGVGKNAPLDKEGTKMTTVLFWAPSGARLPFGQVEYLNRGRALKAAVAFVGPSVVERARGGVLLVLPQDMLEQGRWAQLNRGSSIPF